MNAFYLYQVSEPLFLLSQPYLHSVFGDLQSKKFYCHRHKGNTNRFILFVFALFVFALYFQYFFSQKIANNKILKLIQLF